MKGRRSIQIKLSLAYAAIILAVLVLLNTYPLMMTQDMMFRSKEISLQSQVLLVANALPAPGRLTPEAVEQAVSLEELGGRRLLVTDESALVLYDSAEESAVSHYALLRSLVLALRGNDVFFAEYHDGVFRSYAASPVLTRGRIVGAVYLYEADSSQGVLLKEVQHNLQLISFAVCGLVLLISTLLSRTVTKRIGALLGAIHIVREGEYAHRIAIRGKDELSQLGEEFNQLTDRLQTTEEARRRFVSDASHELKTPLTSIKLLSDSILQGEMERETTLEFVEDIRQAADRLIGISEDLLTLNRLDAGQRHALSPLPLSPVIEKTRKLIAPLAHAADVALLLELPEEELVVLGHEGDFVHIFTNLMENAVKYSLPGGRVLLRLEGTEDWACVDVEDDGMGIPEEDLPHIFERFYRVDKARSRDAGGTGLGLAIVLEAVEIYGGEIRAEASAGGGSCMRLRFPRWKGGDA